MIGWICSRNERHKDVVRKIGRYKDNIIMDLGETDGELRKLCFEPNIAIVETVTTDVTARPHKVTINIFCNFCNSVVQKMRP